VATTPVMDREVSEADVRTTKKAHVGAGTPRHGRSETADSREVWMGERMDRPDIMTPAGIWQVFPLHPKAQAHLKWSWDAIKGSVWKRYRYESKAHTAQARR